MTLAVRVITRAQHLDWVAGRRTVSFLQLPEWGEVKAGWRSESLGWFLGSRLVGAGLIVIFLLLGCLLKQGCALI